MCMLFAVQLSWAHAFPDDDIPTIARIYHIVMQGNDDNPEVVEVTFRADQAAVLVRAIGNEMGRVVQLGTITDGRQQ